MELKILNLGMNGEGVAKINDKVVFIPQCLEGEIVDCEVVKDYKNYATAKLKTIKQASPNRVTPPCRYYETCGGCTLQHMQYDAQLNFKQNLVKNTLKKVANIDADVAKTIACQNQYNYRNKISLSCKENAIGFKQEQSNAITDISACLLAKNEINYVIKTIKNLLAKTYIKSLKNIVIRQLCNQTLIAFVLKQNEDLSEIANDIVKTITNSGVYLIINPRNDSVVIAGKIIHLCGIKNIEINEPLKLNLNVDSFYQTNEDIQTKLYNHILTQIGTDEIVINGYSGAGVLSAMLSKKAKHVYGIEINKSAHINAENLKKCNKISNLTNICGDFFEKYKNLTNSNDDFLSKHEKQINAIVLDPSKKGCGKNVMQTIDGIEKIIYVSCNPIAMAKDLREIIEHYDIQSIQPFDMFPNTTNVETYVVLKKKNN